jgi:hypothetical protein
MTSERWGDILETIKNNFSIDSHDLYERDPDDGGGTEEIIVFDSPLGLIKLTFVSKPLVIGENTLYSNRAGQETKIKREYSDTEKVYTFKAFKWNESRDDWDQMDGEALTF